MAYLETVKVADLVQSSACLLGEKPANVVNTSNFEEFRDLEKPLHKTGELTPDSCPFWSMRKEGIDEAWGNAEQQR